MDDFATKKGHVHATILVDMETGERVDVLPDRTAETFAAWLREHPGVEIVCRDRSGAYAEAVRAAAPHVLQVADWFHLWKSLCDAVEKCVLDHRACLPEPQPDQEHNDQPVSASLPRTPPSEPPTGVRATQRRQRYAAVHALFDKGMGISAIAEALRLDRKTVRRYAARRLA
ncbi:transposase [Nonomuraea zeae]|uniref:transposase n=1 Tax=Nonomuraea zeae TaxID=1642303 RepID=UPI001478F636|nr:transposase [Nonomuraea zeae]